MICNNCNQKMTESFGWDECSKFECDCIMIRIYDNIISHIYAKMPDNLFFFSNKETNESYFGISNKILYPSINCFIPPALYYDTLQTKQYLEKLNKLIILS